MWCCAFESIHNVVRFKNSCRNKISKCVYALYVLCIQKIRYKSDFKIPHNGESWLNRASKLYITFMYAKYIRTKCILFLKKYVEKCTVNLDVSGEKQTLEL